MSVSGFDPRALIARLPRRPGVYRMYNGDEQLLYVGKARQLKARLGSYFGNSAQPPKVAAMLRHVARVEVTVVNTETEALILESNLIKAHRPRYNIILRDDKSYPYVLVVDGHEFPRLVYWRSPRRPPGRLIGPYPDAGAAKEVLLQLQKVFRLRNCRDSFFSHRSRPCLQHQIGRCTAPCVGLISAADYGRDFIAALRVLEGKSDEVGSELRARMQAAASARQFELAAGLRDQVAELERLRSEQIASSARERDADAIAIAGEPGRYALSVLTVRGGQHLGTQQFIQTAVSDAAGTLAAFVLLYYRRVAPPGEIFLCLPRDDTGAIGSALQAQVGRTVAVSHPVRGLPRRWLEQAARNAEQAVRMQATRAERSAGAVSAVTSALRLPVAPQRIECFDVSHTAGEGTVAACVVFTAEDPVRSQYRRYNISGVTPGDDYAALAQALRRHGARIASGELPRADLILIDGGARQLTAAAEALAAAGCGDLPLAAISKGPDRRAGQELIHRPGMAAPIRLDADSASLHWLQRIRDEAHRYAISAHRRRRAARFRESILETVPGLGPVRRRALLNHFGGLQGVLRAGLADLEKVSGIGANLARSLYDHLHPGEQ